MQPTKPLDKLIPETVRLTSVRGHDSLFYALDNGDFLLLAAPSGSGGAAHCRTNMAPHSSKDVTEVVTERPTEVREAFGIRDNVVMLYLDAPEVGDWSFTLEDALVESDMFFGPTPERLVSESETEPAAGDSEETLP